jgi:hypothetical protein
MRRSVRRSTLIKLNLKLLKLKFKRHARWCCARGNALGEPQRARGRTATVKGRALPGQGAALPGASDAHWGPGPRRRG